MNISIGILAHNESASISKTLHSLFQQSLFNKPDAFRVIEVVVVPNGCTDETAEISRAILEELVKQSNCSSIRWQVCEVEQPGKSNAWNLYVHEFSEPATDYLFLMDADIQFLEPDTLLNMINALESSSDAWVSVDKPVKDVVFKKKKSLMDRLSIAVSASKENKQPGICGHLYCSRASVLRGIWIPPDLSVEDNFLSAMVRTDRFTSPDIFDRVILANSASHVFEAYTDLNRLLRHERWLVMSSTINAFIYSYLWANCNEQQDAGTLIKRNNEQNPHWVSELVQEVIQEKGWWLIPNSFLFRRFQKLKNNPPIKALLLSPISVIAFLVDLLIFFQANYELHQGGGLSYWGKSQKAV